MLRSAIAAQIAIAAVGFALPCIGQGEQPPSSLDPSESHGKIELTHEHQRVTSCMAVRAKGELSCVPQLEPSEVGTTVMLQPVRDSKKLARQDQRIPVTVRLADGPGPQREEIELRAGRWKVSWSHYRGQGRFYLVDGDELRIALSTVSGACRKAGARCRLAPAVIRRAVQLPDGRQVP